VSRYQRAIAALREEVTGAACTPAQGRSAILATLRLRRDRRRRLRILLVALAASLLSVVAWAASVRRRGDGPIAPNGARVETALASSKAVTASDRASVVASMPATPSQTSPISSAVIAGTTTGERPRVATGARSPAPKGAGTADGPERPPSAPAPSSSALPQGPSAELLAYEAAHRAHFEERDAARALGLWNAYLARYPSGRWVPEVRWNRAMSLFRLERAAEGCAAIAPFASGDHGLHRRREAIQLGSRFSCSASR
jgi:hypothetical protein